MSAGRAEPRHHVIGAGARAKSSLPTGRSGKSQQTARLRAGCSTWRADPEHGHLQLPLPPPPKCQSGRREVRRRRMPPWLPERALVVAVAMCWTRGEKLGLPEVDWSGFPVEIAREREDREVRVACCVHGCARKAWSGLGPRTKKLRGSDQPGSGGPRIPSDAGLASGQASDCRASMRYAYRPP